MELFDHKGRRVKLEDRHFLTEGGEGKLYVKNQQVYKIWHDVHHLVPVAKLHELQQLDHPQIVRPLGALFDKSGNSIGYMMNQVPRDAVDLPRLFTSSYWAAHHIDLQMMIQLVQRIREVIVFIHQKGFLQVDGNEFNYLVTEKYQRPWFVDVDSYKTPGYPATGIMMSVRDYTQNDFNQGSDWYSFAVVAFQLLTGIHPFKGRHPDYKKGDLESRVINGVSVLDPDVRTPPSVRDFKAIPRIWMEWFKSIFNQGQRVAPPDGKVHVNVLNQVTLIEDGKQVDIKRLAQYPDTVKSVWNHNGHRLVSAGDSLYVGQQRYRWPLHAHGVVLDMVGNPVFLTIEYNRLKLVDAEQTLINSAGLQVEKVFVTNNIAYAINGEDLMELAFHNLGGKKHVSVASTRKILPHATTVYQGVLAQNVLGRMHLLVPGGQGMIWMLPTPELNGVKIIDANYQSGVAVFRIADKNGRYQNLRLLFNPSMTSYTVEVFDESEDILNFTVIDKGHGTNVLVTLPGDHRMEVMQSRVTGKNKVTEIRMIEDDKIQSRMRLVNDANRVAFYVDKGLYSIKMK